MGLVERLLDEPWSRYRARQLGGDAWREHLGWGPAEYLHAILIDALQANTAVTAAVGSRKKPKQAPPFYRPPAREAARAADLDDLTALTAILT